MGLAEENLKLGEQFIEAMNQYDLELMSSVCSEDVVAIEMAEPDSPYRGRDAVIGSYRELFESFPDCHCKSMFNIAGDTGSLIEVVWTGTNEKPFRGEPATGKNIKLLIAYVFITGNGEIKHVHEYYDGVAYEVQMGMR